MSFLSRLLGFDQRKYDKVREAEGFRLATHEEVFGPFAGLRAKGEEAHKSPALAIEFIEEAEAAIARKAKVPFGINVGSLAHHWIENDVSLGSEPKREAFVASFREAHKIKNSPMSAALYAKACMMAAFDARGSGWGHSVSAQAGEQFSAWSDEALTTLGAMGDRYEQALEADEGHLFGPWASQFFASAAPQTSGPQDLMNLFNYCLRSDPYDLHLMRDAGFYLLPRWSGHDENDIEGLAQACTEHTREMYGNGAYAYIYGHTAKTGEDSDDTQCDLEKLDAGYRDLRERFPSVRLHNDHANALVWSGQNERALQVFDEGLRQIDPMTWQFDDDNKSVTEAVSIYSQLKERAR